MYFQITYPAIVVLAVSYNRSLASGSVIVDQELDSAHLATRLSFRAAPSSPQSSTLRGAHRSLDDLEDRDHDCPGRSDNSNAGEKPHE